jgi:dephospho-CoA kinase
MTPMLIGLVGSSGTGKTVITKRLMKKHGFAAVHAGYPVKDAMEKGFKLDPEQVHGGRKGEPAEQLGGVKPKIVLDHVGEAIAKHAPQATSIALHHRLKEMSVNHERVVVDGVRQQAEADLIHKHGGHIVRINPDDPPNPEYPMDARQAKIKEDHVIKGKHQKRQLDDLVGKLG